MNRTVAELVIFFAIVAGFFVVQAQTKHDINQGNYEQNVAQTQAAERGCERTNAGLRQPFYDFVSSAARNRTRLAQTSTGQERAANLAAATEYRGIARLVVQAAQDVAKSPGSPQIDCLAAFPLPPAP